jgi:hypothetical protein
MKISTEGLLTSTEHGGSFFQVPDQCSLQHQAVTLGKYHLVYFLFKLTYVAPEAEAGALMKWAPEAAAAEADLVVSM